MARDGRSCYSPRVTSGRRVRAYRPPKARSNVGNRRCLTTKWHSDQESGTTVGRSLSRLVDVALRTGDLDSLDYVFARLNTLPASDTNGSINYARAKALFARGNYGDAKSAINTVPANSEYTLQAQYLLGVRGDSLEDRLEVA